MKVLATTPTCAVCWKPAEAPAASFPLREGVAGWVRRGYLCKSHGRSLSEFRVERTEREAA